MFPSNMLYLNPHPINYPKTLLFQSQSILAAKPFHFSKISIGQFPNFSSQILKMNSILAIALVALVVPVYGQITTPCNPSVLSSFTPCMNFLTNSTSNGGSPTTDCCGALKNLTSNGLDCLCLIVTGSVPFQLPINRTLAISLPRACNMAGVPVQCKG